MEHTDVAVIGAGRSGLATAPALLCRGLRPVALEASDRTAASRTRDYDSLTWRGARRRSPPSTTAATVPP
ncbi:hypothetical protein ACIQUD_24045 [Streptomyces globisporus]|uniref:hypothetical protein n=1 Tax=Streptomyces globisporus TaxID=1908 RepID=UPI0037F5BA5E